MQYVLGGKKDKSEPDSRTGYKLMGDVEDPKRQPGAGLSKSDVLRWFLQEAQPEDVSWVLGSVYSQKPDVLRQDFVIRPKVRLASKVTNGKKESSSRQLGSMYIELGEHEHELMQAVNSSREPGENIVPDNASVIQFGAEIYFVTEGEEEVVLTLLRIGNLDNTCSIRYCTKAVSAKAGVNFEDAHGTLVFEPGQSMAEIKVDIYDNDHWNNTMEFQVLLEPESCKGCVLGQFLSTTRVKVIDDDVFPSNRCKEAIEEGELDRLGEFTLFYDYCKICWHDPAIWSGSVSMVLVDMLHILHNGVKLLTNVYLVDKVLKNPYLADDPLAARLQLLVCALIFVVPTSLLHYLDFSKCNWKVPGSCRAFLQKALFRKFLDYDDSFRAKQKPGSTIMAVTRDVHTVVAHGYMSIISLAKALFSIISLVVFKIIGNKLFGVAVSPALVVALIAFPVLILPFVHVRKKPMARFLYEQAMGQDEIADAMISTVYGYRLMFDYHQRAKKASEFDQSIMGYNKATTDVVKVNLNNHYFVQWIAAVVVGFYMMVRGYMVVEGSCPLGIYLMDIQIFLQVSAAFSSLFQVLMSITSSKPALERITHLLNLPTSLHSEKTFSASRVAVSRGAMNTKKQNPDEIPLRLMHPKFRYGTDDALGRSTPSAASSASIHLDGDIELLQGQMIAISGQQGQGKSTVLKMLAGVLRAENADADAPSVFVPSHLRALHVTVQPLFFFGSLLENLTYGIPARWREEEKERVREICQKLGVEARAISFLDSDAKMKWGEVFSYSQSCLLNLARALVFNPEILCMDYPAIAFNEAVRANVLKVLREWVAQKGVALHDNKAHLRRPRTCLYTVTGSVGVFAADKVLNFSDGRLQLLETAQPLAAASEGTTKAGAASEGTTKAGEDTTKVSENAAHVAEDSTKAAKNATPGN